MVSAPKNLQWKFKPEIIKYLDMQIGDMREDRAVSQDQAGARSGGRKGSLYCPVTVWPESLNTHLKVSKVWQSSDPRFGGSQSMPLPQSSDTCSWLEAGHAWKIKAKETTAMTAKRQGC